MMHDRYYYLKFITLLLFLTIIINNNLRGQSSANYLIRANRISCGSYPAQTANDYRSLSIIAQNTSSGIQTSISNILISGFAAIAGRNIPVGVEENTTPISANVFLDQNYPNPFTDKTEIRFDMKEYSNVKLSVYDLYGKYILTLTDKKYEPGSYSIIFESVGFPQGVYFYKIISDGYIGVYKMIVMD